MTNYGIVSAALDSTKPDLIHANGDVGLPLLMAATTRGIPIVQHVRVLSFAGFEEHFSASTAIIAVSDRVKNSLARYDVDERKIRTIYDGVDTGRFAPGRYATAEIRNRYGIPQNAHVVLTIARYARNKRYDVLLGAMESLFARNSVSHLVIVGESYREPEVFEMVKQRVKAPPFKGRVTILGFLADVAAIETAADSVVLCSEDEPLGTSILESMALAKPVIVTDSCGLAELITPGANGLIVPAGDVSALTSALETLIRDPAHSAKMGAHARCEIEAAYTVRHCAARVLEVYESITKCDTPRDLQIAAGKTRRGGNDSYETASLATVGVG